MKVMLLILYGSMNCSDFNSGIFVNRKRFSVLGPHRISLLAAPIKTSEEDEEEINKAIASLACLCCSYMIIGWHFFYIEKNV